MLHAEVNGIICFTKVIARPADMRGHFIERICTELSRAARGLSWAGYTPTYSLSTCCVTLGAACGSQASRRSCGTAPRLCTRLTRMSPSPRPLDLRRLCTWLTCGTMSGPAWAGLGAEVLRLPGLVVLNASDNAIESLGEGEAGRVSRCWCNRCTARMGDDEAAICK